jgi:hypothetical protein
MDEFRDELKKRTAVPSNFIDYAVKRLEAGGIDPQEVDIEAFYDPSLSYRENKNRFNEAYPSAYDNMTNKEIKTQEAQIAKQRAEEKAKQKREIEKQNREVAEREKRKARAPSELDYEINDIEAEKKNPFDEGKEKVEKYMDRRKKGQDIKRKYEYSKKKEELERKLQDRQIKKVDKEIRELDRENSPLRLIPRSSMGRTLREGSRPKPEGRAGLPSGSNPFVNGYNNPYFQSSKPSLQSGGNPLLSGQSGNPLLSNRARNPLAGPNQPRQDKYHYVTIVEHGIPRKVKVPDNPQNPQNQPYQYGQPQQPPLMQPDRPALATMLMQGGGNNPFLRQEKTRANPLMQGLGGSKLKNSLLGRGKPKMRRFI